MGTSVGGCMSTRVRECACICLTRGCTCMLLYVRDCLRAYVRAIARVCVQVSVRSTCSDAFIIIILQYSYSFSRAPRPMSDVF